MPQHDDNLTTADEAFEVDLDGFEGPLDLLLELARRQKVELQRISISALAEQYLRFIEEVRQTRLELAADYLVMAAWLAYLKSRLLLPVPPANDEIPAAEMAEALAARLQRLEVIRLAAVALGQRPRLGRDIFVRETAVRQASPPHPQWQASLYDLLTAYAFQRRQKAQARVHLVRRQVWSLPQAREILERLFGKRFDWSELDGFLQHYLSDVTLRPTVKASSFSAILELAREGRIDLRQDRAFSPIWVRSRLERDDVM